MISVLAIDDSPDDLESYGRFLASEAEMFSVDCASNGGEALAKLLTTSPDCIILDYLLVGETGLDLLPKLIEVNPNCPVVMLTGNGSEEVATKAIKAGAADYMIKSTLNGETLARTIELAIERWEMKTALRNQQQEQESFLSTLVHDARTPLRNIKHLVAEVADEIEDTKNEQSLQMLQMLQSSTRQLSDLVDTLSTYALLDGDIEFHLVDLNKVAQDVKFSFESQSDSQNATISIGDLPKVWGHEPQLQQLFQNLVGNALKFNKSSAPTVSISAVNVNDRHWRIEFADNGLGIAPGDTQRIFEPFRRLWTADKFNGSGLGLAICRKIAARHDGDIWCQPREGGGTQFFVELNTRKFAGFADQANRKKAPEPAQ